MPDICLTDEFDPEHPDVSVSGLAFTCGWEGWVPHRYRDPIGLWTWGYGHLERPGDKESFPVDANGNITKAFGTQLLHTDGQKCVKAIVDAVHPNILASFTQHMFNALFDWLFNCGPGAIGVSILLKHVNEGSFNLVPNDLCQWCKVTVNGQRIANPSLLVRRRKEGELWLSPDVVCPIGVEGSTRGIVPEIPEEDRAEYEREGAVLLRQHGWDLLNDEEHDFGSEDPH